MHAKRINSRAHCVTPQTTMSFSVTWYNAELCKAQSLKAVLVGELCEAAYDRLDAAAPLTHRQQQFMRIYTAHLLLRIKRVTSELDDHSRIVWPREGTNSLLVEDHTLISRQCMRLLKCELLLLCRLCLAAYELLEVNAQQRSMRRFMINLRSCIKRVTRRDHSQSSDVWSCEETSALSSDAQQDETYKASKGHTRIRRRRSDKCAVRDCIQHTKRNRTTNTTGECAPEEIQGQTASDSEYRICVGCHNKRCPSTYLLPLFCPNLSLVWCQKSFHLRLLFQSYLSIPCFPSFLFQTVSRNRPLHAYQQLSELC